MRAGLSLCGGGFLGAYHVGALRALRGGAPSWVRRAPVVGSSVGAVVGAMHVCNADGLHAAMHELCDSVRREVGPLGILTPGFSLVTSVREVLDRALPPNAHVACSGRMHVGVTVLDRSSVRFALVADFSSRDELLDAVVASSFVPGVTATLGGGESGWPTNARGGKQIDGGLTANWPALPAEVAERTVRVSAFPGTFDIAPAAGAARTVPVQGGLRLALHPSLPRLLLECARVPSAEQVDAMEERGFRDAALFLERASNRGMVDAP